MKKFLMILALIATMSTSFTTEAKAPKQINPKIEVVNDQTVIFKNVVKIELFTVFFDQTTYIYDLKHGKLITVANGTFAIELPMGDYLVQSNKKITRTNYEVIEE